MRKPKLETEGLLAGVRLAEKNIANKKFRGNSKNRTVSIRIDGRQHPDEVRIDPEAFDVSKEQAEEIAAAVQEAMQRAVENAQKAAAKLLEEELH